MKSLIGMFSRGFEQVRERSPLLYSAIGFIVVIILATILLYLNSSGQTYHYSIGDIASEDIRVPRNIHYIKEKETRIARERASEAVPIVFDRDSSVLLERLKLSEILFRNIQTTLINNPPIGTDDLTFQLVSLKSKLPRYLMYSDKILLPLLSYRNTTELKKIASRILIHIYDNREMGILNEPYRNPLKLPNKNITIRLLNTEGSGEEIPSNLDNLMTIPDLKKKIYTICYSIAPNLPRSTLYSLSAIIRGSLKPNMRFNEEETRRRINEVSREVKPVMGLLKKGQTIVREGDTITIDMINRIEVLNRYSQTSNITYIAGIFIIQLIFFMVFGYFLIEYSDVLIPDRNASIIITFLLISFMLFTYFVYQFEGVRSSGLLFPLFLPIPFVTMMLAIIYNMYLAVIVGTHVIFFSVMIMGGDMFSVIIAVSSAILGVFVNWNVQQRTDFLRGGFFLGFINAIVVVGLSLIQESPASLAFKNVQLAFASGIINSILVLGIFPLFESLFGITTKFKLLELGDLNADIFKQMLIYAPGTYHHSLMVSNLAETACKEIRADHLLARVGAFYHDIGKIEDAGMFIENRVTDPRARTLSPRYYSRLIISHVDKGVAIARRHGLPGSIIDFIQQHHGETTMTYFYHKALEGAAESGDEGEIKKSEFQYPGPKPRSRETAVVMLADAVEAASRSMQEPTDEKLKGMVSKIIYNKLNEGELEYTDLSMSDLRVIQDSFLQILSGVYHTRIAYPESSDVQNLEEKIEKKVKRNSKNKNGETAG